MSLPPELKPLAAKAAGAALLSILVALLLALAGAFGLWSFSDEPWRGEAKVVAVASCGQADAREEIVYQRDGAERRATFDACGHLDGETIKIAVRGETVSAAEATSGASTDARPLGVILCVFAGIAGAGLTELWRRIPS